MKFELRTPCPKCPFRRDVKPYLRRDRAQEIADGLTRQQQTFACHLTVKHDDDGEPRYGPHEQHCAGALIILEAMNRPNQMMRIAERMGVYDRRKLATDAPVFGTMREFVAAQQTTKRRGEKVK